MKVNTHIISKKILIAIVSALIVMGILTVFSFLSHQIGASGNRLYRVEFSHFILFLSVFFIPTFPAIVYMELKKIKEFKAYILAGFLCPLIAFLLMGALVTIIPLIIDILMPPKEVFKTNNFNVISPQPPYELKTSFPTLLIYAPILGILFSSFYWLFAVNKKRFVRPRVNINLKYFKLLSSLILLVGVIGVLSYLVITVYTINQKHSEFQESYSHTEKRLTSKLASVSNQMDATIKRHRTILSKQNNDFDELQKKNSSLEEKLQQTNKNLNDLAVKFFAATKILSEPIAYSSANKDRMSFDFYKGDEWSNEMSVSREEAKIFNKKYKVKRKHNDVDRGNTLVANNKSLLSIDGIQYSGFDTYIILDASVSKAVISLPSLAEIKDDTLTVIADPFMDKVYLDGCLAWEKLETVETDFLTYKATDIKGKSRFLRVTQNVDIFENKQCNPNYTHSHKVSIVSSMGGSNNQSIKPDLRKVPDTVPKSYTIGDTDNLEIYREWIKGIKDTKVRRNVRLLTDIMQHTELPTEFPRAVKFKRNHYFMQPLYFNPKKSKTYYTQSVYKCGRDMQRESGLFQTSFVVARNNRGATKIDCSWNNQFYFLGDGDDTLKDSWDHDIVFPAKGNDKLDLGWGQDIVVLEKGWGKKTINKTCSFSKTKDAIFHSSTNTKAAYIGLGLQFSIKNKLVFVLGVVKGSPAERVGLKRGDWITKIDNAGVDLFDQDFIVNTMRGSRNKSIDITYKSHPTNEIKTVHLKKGVVDILDNHQRAKLAFREFHEPNKGSRISYKWPFKYNNFVVFGPGINKEDFEWTEKNKAVLKETGDELIFSNDTPCFNFVYAGDMTFDEPTVTDENHTNKIEDKADSSHLLEKKNTDIKNDVKLEHYSKVPSELGLLIRIKNNKESYIELVERQFKKASGGSSYIDAGIVQKIEDDLTNRAQMQQRVRILMHDRNFDNTVTLEEVLLFVNKENPDNQKRIDSYTKKIMDADSDSDGRITPGEMIALSTEVIERRKKLSASAGYNKYMRLDPNKDGTITLEELITLSKKAFIIIDLDQDGVISREEYNGYRKSRNKKDMSAMRF